jgi:anti-sigma B factor antagonist
MNDHSEAGPGAGQGGKNDPPRGGLFRYYTPGSPGMKLKINIRENGPVTILDINGRLMAGEAVAELRDTIRELLESEQKNLVLNLEGVSHIDSSGLGQLVGSFATVSNHGGRLKLLNLQGQLRDVLHATKLYTVFETYSTEKAALWSFRAEAGSK